MRRKLFGVTAGAMVVVAAAALVGSALGAQGHGFGPRMPFHGFRASGGGPGGLLGGPMFFGGPGGFGMRIGMGPGGPGGPGGGGVTTSDVLTPAAGFLGVSVSTLAADLAGGKTLAQEATAKSKKADDLISAIVAAQKTNLDNQKAAGWITADQETAILARYTEAVTDLVNNGPPVPPAARTGGLLETAATFLGVSVSDLQTSLKSGKSLADVAKDKSKSVDDLVTALLAPAKKNLDQAVTDGKITSAQETAILNKMTTGLTNLVNHTKPTSGQMSSTQSTMAKIMALRTFGKRH
jgi:D-Tyr-tRNAtyr deacylase